MPNAGDTFTITLKQAHTEWGTHRHTSTRDAIDGEAYLPIPRAEAERLGIFNSNQPSAITDYRCNSTDGLLVNAILKASGSSKAGDIYAKQFQGRGDLQLLGNWFDNVGANVGDQVKITWTGPNDITITKI